MTSDGSEGHLRGWKDIIRHFAPAWFAVTMGTGAISNLFYVFPYGNNTSGMKIISLAFFFLNLLLFVLFSVISTARYLIWPDVWRIMLRHPVQSLYTGTAPMGATTLLNVGVNLINRDYQFGGKPLLYVLWGLWWLDVLVSMVCCWGQVHYMETGQKHALERMTPVWLLPVVTLIVAASTGGVMAEALHVHSPSHALITATCSALLVSIGLSLALMMLTVYLLRLIVHGLPPGGTIISAFLPLGPTGQAGFAILLLGDFFRHHLPLKDSESTLLASQWTGEIISVICVILALVLWSLATMWMIFAFLGLQNVIRQGRIPFKVTIWGLIFPNGVYANLTINLARVFDSPVFRIWGAIYAIVTLLMWSFVAFKTVIAVRGGHIFEAPCLDEEDLTARLNNGVKCASTR